jgi:hypothetical protein
MLVILRFPAPLHELHIFKSFKGVAENVLNSDTPTIKSKVEKTPVSVDVGKRLLNKEELEYHVVQY